MYRCYNCVLVAQWGSILRFGVMRGALFPCHPYVVHIGVVVLVGTHSEVAQGNILEYPPYGMSWRSSDLASLHLEVVALVEWQSC